jgi:hypothetical protein
MHSPQGKSRRNQGEIYGIIRNNEIDAARPFRSETGRSCPPSMLKEKQSIGLMLFVFTTLSSMFYCERYRPVCFFYSLVYLSRLLLGYFGDLFRPVRILPTGRMVSLERKRHMRTYCFSVYFACSTSSCFQLEASTCDRVEIG